MDIWSDAGIISLQWIRNRDFPYTDNYCQPTVANLMSYISEGFKYCSANAIDRAKQW